MKKLLTMLFTFAVVFSLAMPVFVQNASAQSTDTTTKTKKTKKAKVKKTKKDTSAPAQ